MRVGPPSLPPADYRFSQALPLVPNAATRRWETVAPLWFEIGGKGSGALVCVPRGFETDLATIPGLARIFFNPADPRFARAAVIHDYLLSLPDFSPLTAAIAFRDALRAAKAPAWRVAMMVTSVAIWTCARRGRL